MRAHIRIGILVFVLAGFVLIGFLSSAQQLSLPPMTSSTSNDLPLFLNGEPIGSVSNTGPLVNRLQSLRERLDSNSNAANGSLPNIGRLIVVPDKQLSGAGLGRTWEQVEEFFSYPPHKRMILLIEQPCAGNAGPASRNAAPGFVLSNSPLSAGELENVKANRCWLDTRVIAVTRSAAGYTERLLKSYRTAVTSLEITDGGSYLLNDRVKDARLRASPGSNLANPTLRRKIDAATVVQRPLNGASLKREIDAWIETRIAESSADPFPDEDGVTELPLIIGGAVSYNSLSRVLGLIGKQKVEITIVVDNTPPVGPLKKPAT